MEVRLLTGTVLDYFYGESIGEFKQSPGHALYWNNILRERVKGKIWPYKHPAYGKSLTVALLISTNYYIKINFKGTITTYESKNSQQEHSIPSKGGIP